MKTSAVDQGRRSLTVATGEVDAAAARSFSWIEELLNDTGADILEGSVVVVLADGTIELADTENDPRPTGVVVDQIDDGDTGQVVFGGPVDLVLVTASVTGGEFGQTSTTPGEAQVTAQFARAFCMFTSSGTEPSAFLWGGRGGGGVLGGAVIEDLDTAETDTSLFLHPDGTGGVEWTADGGGGSGYYYRAEDFGVVADGVTDDTVALQAAIDGVPDYATIFCKGHMIISDTLVIGHPVRLLGDSSEPNWFDTSTIIEMVTANTTAFSCTDFEGDFSVAYLSITGEAGFDRDATSGSRGIYTAANLNLHAVKIRGFYDGVYIDDSLGGGSSSAYYNHISNCWLHYNTNAGLYLKDQVNNLSVRETYFAFNEYGLQADGGAWGVRIIGNSFEVNDTAGIRIDGTGASQSTSGVQISGNYFEQLNSVVPSAVADIQLGPTELVYGTLIEGNMFVACDITALWHVDANHTISTVLVGNFFGTNSEAGSFRFDGTNSSHVLHLNNYVGGTISTPATTRLVDATDVTPASVGVANAVGTSKWFSRADHVHDGSGSGPSFATPAIALGTSAAAGAASTVIRSDSTIVAFDATVPVIQAFGDSAATGSAAFAARRDHKHGMPATPTGGTASTIFLIADNHSTPIVFADLLLNEAGDNFLDPDQ